MGGVGALAVAVSPPDCLDVSRLIHSLTVSVLVKGSRPPSTSCSPLLKVESGFRGPTPNFAELGHEVATWPGNCASYSQQANNHSKSVLRTRTISQPLLSCVVRHDSSIDCCVTTPRPRSSATTIAASRRRATTSGAPRFVYAFARAVTLCVRPSVLLCQHGEVVVAGNNSRRPPKNPKHPKHQTKTPY